MDRHASPLGEIPRILEFSHYLKVFANEGAQSQANCSEQMPELSVAPTGKTERTTLRGNGSTLLCLQDHPLEDMKRGVFPYP